MTAPKFKIGDKVIFQDKTKHFWTYWTGQYGYGPYTISRIRELRKVDKEYSYELAEIDTWGFTEACFLLHVIPFGESSNFWDSVAE